MPLHKVLHQLLTLALLSALASSCETDADEIDISAGEAANVMTSVFAPDGPVRVYVTGSVEYTSLDRESTVGRASVSLSVNGEARDIAAIGEGQTSVLFGSQALAEGDSVTVVADIENGAELRATAKVMPRVVIERADTATSVDRQSLRFTVRMSDPEETADFYLMEARRVSYKGGVPTDTAIRCDYESSVFYDLTSSVSAASAIGIFHDERLSRNSAGVSTLRLAVPWDVLRIPAERSGADSTFACVRLYHLSEDHYNFLSTSSYSGDYVLLPVFGSASVSSNVTGGYGIVACTVYDERRFKIQ